MKMKNSLVRSQSYSILAQIPHLITFKKMLGFVSKISKIIFKISLTNYVMICLNAN